MRRRGALLAIAALAAGPALVPASLRSPEAIADVRPNVIIIMSDDQRSDKITPQYTPQIWNRLVLGVDPAHPNAATIPFTNSFVSNPECCPSRTTTLSGDYSHTTGVWDNHLPYGGFSAFDDKHTIAVDFQQQGYRTALVGKYLNGYAAGKTTYVPPGWDAWFATNTGAYYDYGVTRRAGPKLVRYGDSPKDYSTRVLTDRALRFATAIRAKPFFLYLAFSAPHGPAIPEPRDVGRFAGEPDHHYGANQAWPSSALESAYGVDRAVGKVLNAVPDDTIVIYMSDNGLMWQQPESDRGVRSGKRWPYNDSIRVPIVYASLDGTRMPVAGVNDIVANVDLRTSLLHAAGLAPLTSQEGVDWFSAGYVPRSYLEIEHGGEVPTYCGVRTADDMYARFHEADGSYTDELFRETPGAVDEATNLWDPSTDLSQELQGWAEAACDPTPPGFSW